MRELHCIGLYRLASDIASLREGVIISELNEKEAKQKSNTSVESRLSPVNQSNLGKFVDLCHGHRYEIEILMHDYITCIILIILME